MSEERCGGAPTLIFACSGAANTGAMADLAARKLARGGAGKMYCLAGLGADIQPMIDTSKAAGKVLAIDGCPTDCARKTLERVGIEGSLCVRVTELGIEKGKTPVTDEVIVKVAAAATEKLA